MTWWTRWADVALAVIVVIGMAFGGGIGLAVYWWLDPPAYGIITAEIPDQFVGAELQTIAKVSRKRLCPYRIDRRVFDASGRRVLAFVRDIPAPDKLGFATFESVWRLDGTPVPGPAVDYTITWSMCNPLRRLFPLLEARVTTQFNFLPAQLKEQQP